MLIESNRPKSEKGKVRSTAEATRKRIEVRFKPAKASNYLYFSDDYIIHYRETGIVLYCRDSTVYQDLNGNNDTQEAILRDYCGKMGIPVIDCIHEPDSGKLFSGSRCGLIKTCILAKQHNSAVLAISADRFLRNQYYEGDLRVMPTDIEFQLLCRLTDNTKLLTMLPPDLDAGKVRGFQTKWGQEAKGDPGGRPKINLPGYKKQRREDKQEQAIELRRSGTSINQIAKALGVPKTTVHRWIKESVHFSECDLDHTAIKR